LTHRYITSFKFSDPTGQLYMTVFDDDCQKLLGMSADELYEMEISPGMDGAFKDVWKRTLFTEHVVRVRAKSEIWEDKARIKCTVVDMKPVNYVEESKLLLDKIRNYGV
jgi:replication factor A1